MASCIAGALCIHSLSLNLTPSAEENTKISYTIKSASATHIYLFSSLEGTPSTRYPTPPTRS